MLTTRSLLRTNHMLRTLHLLYSHLIVTPTAAVQAPSAEETEPFETDESAATPPPHP
nr:hypothetical protein [Tanacetum cinerariifolium]